MASTHKMTSSAEDLRHGNLHTGHLKRGKQKLGIETRFQKLQEQSTSFIYLLWVFSGTLMY